MNEHFTLVNTAIDGRERALLDFLLAFNDDAITCMTPDGTLIAWSKRAQEMFGYSAEEMIGRKVDEIFPLFAAADVIAIERKRLARAAAGEVIPPYETTRTRRDGSTLNLLLSAHPIRNREGEIVAVARVSRDITQKKAHAKDSAFLSWLVESSSDAIVSYAPDGTLRTWNPGAERMFGYTAAEMIGTTFQQRIGKFTAFPGYAVEEDAMNRAAAGEYVPPFEAVRTRKDGTVVTVLTSVYPVRDAQGNLVGVGRIMRDISERKSHEQDRALLSQIVQSSSDGIISYALDGTITSWNRAAETIYGYTAEEMIGTSLLARIGEFVGTERSDEEIRLNDRVAAGEIIPPFETVRTRKDGSQASVLVSVSAVRDLKGNVIGTSRTVRDISERGAAEEQRALFGSIVESSNDAIYTKKLDGTITTWNPAAEALFGYTAEEMIGHPVLQLFSPDHITEEVQMLARIRAGETIRHYETVRVHKSGRRIDVSVTVSPIRNTSGEIFGVSSVVRDVTERKEYEARIKTMQDDLAHVARLNELGQVSAGIAHELNQPLAALLNYANLAKRVLNGAAPGATEKATEALVKASQQALRAGEIIRRMRSFVEKRQSNRTLEDMNAVVEDTMALGLMGADAANVSIRLELASMLPQVLVDRVQMQQVLVNLLHNAADAMVHSPKREITVRTQVVSGDTVEVSVSDTGPGIAKEHIDRLFMPFFTTKPGGMGIGLVISRSIIEAHGGRIAVESQAGSGAVFRITLPAVLPV